MTVRIATAKAKGHYVLRMCLIYLFIYLFISRTQIFSDVVQAAFSKLFHTVSLYRQIVVNTSAISVFMGAPKIKCGKKIRYF